MTAQASTTATTLNPIVRKRVRKNRIIASLSVAATGAGLFLLAWILGYLLFKGFTLPPIPRL